MSYTYTLALDDPQRVTDVCCSVAQSFIGWGEMYGIFFESMINNGDGTLSITLSEELPLEEAKSIRLVESS